MASHQEQRRAAAREAAKQAETKRAQRVQLVVTSTIVLVVAAVVVLVVLLQRGQDPVTPATASAGARSGALLTGPPPWPAQPVGLAGRIEPLAFPPAGDESYHAHVLLSVFRNGEQVQVPDGIGFDTRGAHSSLHTHTPDGVIHMEADDPYPYELSQVFTSWGVTFGEDRLGGDVATATEKVWIYVNGEPAPSGPVMLKDQDNIVVAFGEQGSFPTLPSAAALQGA